MTRCIAGSCGGVWLFGFGRNFRPAECLGLSGFGWVLSSVLVTDVDGRAYMCHWIHALILTFYIFFIRFLIFLIMVAHVDVFLIGEAYVVVIVTVGFVGAVWYIDRGDGLLVVRGHIGIGCQVSGG